MCSVATNCVAVIPCLNEARTIERLVNEIREQIPAVIVVDDGSSDDTGATAQAAGAEVIRRKESGGKGIALREGFGLAIERGFQWGLALDGDGQHSPADVPKFLERATVSNAQMVVGNRMDSAEAMPFVRQFVNRWMSGRLSEFCGVQLPDSQCGFRLVNLDSWRLFEFSAEHFEMESELLVRFIAAGLKVEFVPIETRYAGEQSKIHPVRDTVRWFRWWRTIRREFAGRGDGQFVLSKSPDISKAAVE
jgi:glycosyltransferase involved in cell wall biosynthesis